MGKQLFDQYSLLHFAVGVIMYFFSVPLWLWNLIHIIFEIVENTTPTMIFITKYITIWPGGKSRADSINNRIGDVTSGCMGWMVAYWLDTYK